MVSFFVDPKTNFLDRTTDRFIMRGKGSLQTMNTDFEKCRALIVDDNDFVRHMLVKQLTMFGFEHIEQASEGFEAINKVTEFNPDIIICDINMQPLDGFDFLSHLRRLGGEMQSIPVIFLTSHGSQDFVERAKGLDVDAYLLKPVLPQKLYAQICKVLKTKGEH